MTLSKKEQNELLSLMAKKQNKVNVLNAGQQREQIKIMFEALSKCSAELKLAILKKI